MTNQQRIKKLETILYKLYLKESKKLLFHGWHHIDFVRNKALDFAKPIKANLFLVESAALVHDLNYIVKPNSRAGDGFVLRAKILPKCGYSPTEIKRIEQIILECETQARSGKISLEGKALSDGDTLFKALPTTPILFASKYLTENKVDILKLANNIVKHQKPLLQKGIYFYTSTAKKNYLKWAKNNIYTWELIKESLSDKDVQQLLKTAQKLKVIK